ncbi:MAG: protein-L-isoaspartate(D-aspartate) O-methyltransferase [Bacteroidota bacterium]
MTDTYKHKGLRQKLIEKIRRKGIIDENVLDAMEKVPRHFFLDSAFAHLAYKDQPVGIGRGQTISQPYTVAFQSQLLEVGKRMRVLEIGTGSGYQAAILGMLGARVFTVERHEELYLKSKELLESKIFGNIRCYFRDGTKGLKEFAPYDRIIVTAGAIGIPDALLNQLKIGGMLVIPVGDETQVMYRVIKKSATEFKKEEWGGFRFVPLLEGKEKK